MSDEARRFWCGDPKERLLTRLFIWWAFLDTYRTLCLAPTPEIREIFEILRTGHFT
jgi:hypothetical protein